MLPKQPLRYVLADDPGAGKTIMAGLFISELLPRADARRIMVVSPRSLTEQWQDELFENLACNLKSSAKKSRSSVQRAIFFTETDRLICRLISLPVAKIQRKLRNTDWDLIIVDEAHKLSANYLATKSIKPSASYLGELLDHLPPLFC